ncbi:alanyl-tRNA editing protein [Paraburkholderia bonniea]|uniref:alanyl-tRNA editing protein n=1 Tax=Paraburkholderia bonniea TaxID=2152891 RepID=UPI00129254DF|nr:alanyl-tRNA editing protein [Paraburkholderia bonniea]WJF90033.1 alanyl-tRNA editing protein [Paraburkholderia bonniea]WJF93347.1 alanyl-tRNA editing protein [Paraburkholderia bonniea]
MLPFSRATSKLYYSDTFLSQTQSSLSKIGRDYVELDATVAYPEGGGQESDVGTLLLPDGAVMRFIHARKMYGQRPNIPDFPDVQTGGVVEHIIHAEDLHHLERLKKGDEVQISIDILRRAQLSLSHTASHLLYLGVGQIRPDALTWTLGCHIRTDGARFDFGVSERFTPEEVSAIEQIANDFVARASEVTTYAHPQHIDARYWQCEGHVMPCGGTHIGNTAPIGRIAVRRKSMGAGKERLSCQFDSASFDLAPFHANACGDRSQGGAQ